MVIQVRKLLTLQKFHCPASKHFIDNKLIDSVDCCFLAMQFESVITLQIHKIESQPELKEEILLSIFDYVDCFVSFLKNE